MRDGLLRAPRAGALGGEIGRRGAEDAEGRPRAGARSVAPLPSSRTPSTKS